jgi:penicillin-insensitive murein DD-endopeptidase
MLRFVLSLILIIFAAAALAQQPLEPQTVAAPAKPKPKPKTAKKTPPKPKSPIARELFAAAPEPAPLAARSIGAYSKGCLAGGVSLPINGPDWQVMRLTRNRNWGNPRLIDYLERLASDAHAFDGWPGLLIGDMSQPRGGPMLSGHTSHQIGLDADIWLTPMPDRNLSPQERENMEAVSMLKDPFTVDPAVFTMLQVKLIKRAASYPQVTRIFVHPAIKKALCQMAPQAGKDTAWLGKVRPWWNHHYHFHVRLACPPGTEGCEDQKPPTGDNGCGQELTNWYAMLKTSAIATAKAPAGASSWKGKPPLTMAQLPKECGDVLKAGGFEPPIPDEAGKTEQSPAVLAALATKDAGPPVPVLTPAQLKALLAKPGEMTLPDRNPLR